MPVLSASQFAFPIVFFNAAVAPDHFAPVFFHKSIQPFLKLFRAFSRRIDMGDADAPIRFSFSPWAAG